MGAAIQGGIFTGDVKDIVLIDVLPLSLGLETRGGLFVKLINRNTTIPFKNTMTFTTVVDNQQSVEIHILQGEREIASANRSLAKFELVGIPPAPRGVPQVDVTFSIDANGLVSVSAQDKLTGLEQATQITPSSGLAPEEISRLIQEAETSIERDKEMKDVIIQRNRLDSLITNARRALDEYGKNLSPEDQQNIREVLSKAQTSLTSADMGEIYAELVRVEQAASKITESMMSTVS
jgi:molecular chaperone DnaK